MPTPGLPLSPVPLSLGLYASRARIEPLAVDDLVTDSRQRNARLGVTGVLAFTGGHFLQVLEGPSATVIGLLERVGRDPRHEAFRLLLCEPRADRLFGRWAMAMLPLEGADDLARRLVDGSPVSPARARALVGHLRAWVGDVPVPESPAGRARLDDPAAAAARVAGGGL